MHTTNNTSINIHMGPNMIENVTKNNSALYWNLWKEQKVVHELTIWIVHTKPSECPN